MFNKITLDGEVYGSLGTIKVNNREYVFTINKNNLSYLEVVTNDKREKTYIKPLQDLSLAGNAGTSLTRLNERILMQHIADGIKDDITSGKIVNQEQLEKTISDRQQVLLTNPQMRKLLKGTGGNDLTEDGFNKNIASLIDCIDTSVKIMNKPDDDFEIVEDGLDRTFINASMYAQLNNKPVEEQPEMVSTPEEVETIDTPEVSNVEETVEPLKEEIKEPEKLEENNLVDIEDYKKPVENATLEVSAEITKEEIKEKAQMLLKKPDKRAAYVDTVIICLITQLGIFGLLIFVLLLIK